jgi:putative flippase GtrA
VIHQFKSKQFLVFLLTGGTAAMVNFASRFLYSPWLDFPVAVVAAYCTGMVVAFLLARIFVFKNSQQPLHLSMMYFVLVNLAGIAQTWVVSMALAYYALPALGIEKHVQAIAHAFGIMVPAFTSYLGHKHFSFKADPRT